MNFKSVCNAAHLHSSPLAHCKATAKCVLDTAAILGASHESQLLPPTPEDYEESSPTSDSEKRLCARTKYPRQRFLTPPFFFFFRGKSCCGSVVPATGPPHHRPRIREDTTGEQRTRAAPKQARGSGGLKGQGEPNKTCCKPY